jgi:hypothetical protein
MGKRVELRGNRWTYLGLIDDKVAEYPWSGRINKKYLDAILRWSALFEEPILLNDGYLLHYNWARNELMDPTSLLRQLISKQHVVVFSRRKDGRLDRMVEDMAPTVKSYETLSGSKGWSERQGSKRPLKERLEEVSTDRDYHYTTWPNMKAFDNRKGFDAIVDELTGDPFDNLGLASMTGKDFERVVNQYKCIRNEENSSSIQGKQPRGARTVWEEVAKAHCHGDSRRLSALMWLGNEVYHYNMTLAVAATAQASVNVSTFASDRMVSHFAKKATPAAIDSKPLPPALSTMPSEAFVELVDHVARTRTKYRDAVRSYLQSSGRAHAETELGSALDEYSDAIGSWCAHEYNQKPLTVKAGLAGVFLTVAGTVTGVAIGSVLTAGIAGIAALLTAGVLPHFVAAWHGHGVSRQLKETGAPPITPKTGTFELDRKKAEQHIERSK